MYRFKCVTTSEENSSIAETEERSDSTSFIFSWSLLAGDPLLGVYDFLPKWGLCVLWFDTYKGSLS